MDEIWVSCLRLARYQVSNMGRIRIQKTGQIIKTRKDTRGYVVATLHTREYRERCWGEKLRSLSVFGRVAVLVMQSFSKEIKARDVVRYKDGDRSNCRLDNLYWAKRADIIRENWAKNYRKPTYRFPKGILNPRYIDGRWSASK